MTQTKNNYELKNFKITGYSDDFTTCECCGKQDLKGTVHIQDLENMVVMHFGTTCAAKADKYDSLEAAYKAKEKIQSLTSVIKRVKQYATENTINLMRKKDGFKEYRFTDAYMVEFEAMEKVYFDANIERAVFLFVNADQIKADKALAQDEIYGSEEYKIMQEYRRLIDIEGEKFFNKDPKLIRNSEGYQLATNNLMAKRDEVISKYPSLKYDTYISC